MLRIFAPVLLLFACSCTAMGTQGIRPSSAYIEAPDEGVFSLFSADSDAMSDADIAAAMNIQWKAPEHIRIALLQVNYATEFTPYPYRYTRINSNGMGTAEDAVELMRTLPGVFDVSYMPEFLLPPDKSIGLLRQVAARYQADWLFLYSSKIVSTTKYRVFASDEVDGICMVECALLDTRTGLIPFTARSTQAMHVKEKSSGESMPLLVERAEREAVNEAMLKNAQLLKSFLANARRN